MIELQSYKLRVGRGVSFGVRGQREPGRGVASASTDRRRWPQPWTAVTRPGSTSEGPEWPNDEHSEVLWYRHLRQLHTARLASGSSTLAGDNGVVPRCPRRQKPETPMGRGERLAARSKAARMSDVAGLAGVPSRRCYGLSGGNHAPRRGPGMGRAGHEQSDSRSRGRKPRRGGRVPPGGRVASCCFLDIEGA